MLCKISEEETNQSVKHRYPPPITSTESSSTFSGQLFRIRGYSFTYFIQILHCLEPLHCAPRSSAETPKRKKPQKEKEKAVAACCDVLRLVCSDARQRKCLESWTAAVSRPETLQRSGDRQLQFDLSPFLFCIWTFTWLKPDVDEVWSWMKLVDVAAGVSLLLSLLLASPGWFWCTTEASFHLHFHIFVPASPRPWQTERETPSLFTSAIAKVPSLH